MSRLPFSNFSSQQFGHGKPMQNNLVQRQPWPEESYHQNMCPPPHSEYHMQQPPPPPTWVSPPPPPTWVPPPPPTWVPPPPQMPPPVQPLPLPPMTVPPPSPAQTSLYPSGCATQTHIGSYQSTISNQEQQQYYISNMDDDKKLDDQDWVNKWINEIILKKEKKIQEKGTANDIKLYKMRDKIANAVQCVRELENSARVMNVMVKTVDEVEWNRKCEEVENKKIELELLLRDLESTPGLLECMQEKVQKRRKKREYLKRRAARWKKRKQENQERREMLHKQIDLWLNDMEENVERSRREEELKQQADAVLSSVMQKKAEARKQIALLSALLQLRQARVTAMLGTGRSVSQTQINTFNEVIEKLKAMWTKQLDEYLLEEQGLRVMLTESEVYKIYSAKPPEKQIYLQWEEALFGIDNSNKGEPVDKEEFIERRRTWDHFVVNEKTVMASSIPIGWVLPVPPSDDVWKKQLKSLK